MLQEEKNTILTSSPWDRVTTPVFAKYFRT